MISTLIDNEVVKTIKGPAGQLELIYGPPTVASKHIWAIICHPHSLHGGTMHNKVVTTLAKTFRALGADTVRFNFRGVGASAGSYDQGVGELDDLMAVMDWVLAEKPKSQIWLAGFSFGAYIAALAATRIPVANLITVAPPVENFHMEQLPPIMSPWILIQGEKDEVVSSKAVVEWAKSREPVPTILLFPTATHFFHGQLVSLREELTKVLTV